MTHTPEQARMYYLRNRERILEQQAAYRAIRDPEKARERDRDWKRRARAAEPEKYRAQMRARYAEDPEKVLERNRGWRARNRESWLASTRIRGLRDRHGMWPQDWAAIWAAQGGRCYLCGDELITAEAVIDHDHSCCPPGKSCPSCRRGLVHDGCNVAIGLLKDDPDRLRRMADALETAQQAVDQRKASAGEQLDLGMFA